MLVTDRRIVPTCDARVDLDPLTGIWRCVPAVHYAGTLPPRVRFRHLRGGWAVGVGEAMQTFTAFRLLEHAGIDLRDASAVREALAEVAAEAPGAFRRLIPGVPWDFRSGRLYVATADGISGYRHDGQSEDIQLGSGTAVNSWLGAVPGGLGAEGGEYEPLALVARLANVATVHDLIRALAAECARVAERTAYVTEDIEVAMIGCVNGYLAGPSAQVAGLGDAELNTRIAAAPPSAPIVDLLNTLTWPTSDLRQIPSDDPAVRFREAHVGAPVLATQASAGHAHRQVAPDTDA